MDRDTHEDDASFAAPAPPLSHSAIYLANPTPSRYTKLCQTSVPPLPTAYPPSAKGFAGAALTPRPSPAAGEGGLRRLQHLLRLQR